MTVPPLDQETAHQGINAGIGLIVGVAGEVGVSGRGKNRVVAEDFLDFAQVDAGFDQVRREATPQVRTYCPAQQGPFFSPRLANG